MAIEKFHIEGRIHGENRSITLFEGSLYLPYSPFANLSKGTLIFPKPENQIHIVTFEGTPNISNLTFQVAPDPNGTPRSNYGNYELTLPDLNMSTDVVPVYSGKYILPVFDGNKIENHVEIQFFPISGTIFSL